MRRLLQLIGVAHSRCPLAEAIAAGVRARLDDRDTREHVEHCQTDERTQRDRVERIVIAEVKHP